MENQKRPSYWSRVFHRTRKELRLRDVAKEIGGGVVTALLAWKFGVAPQSELLELIFVAVVGAVVGAAVGFVIHFFSMPAKMHAELEHQLEESESARKKLEQAVGHIPEKEEIRILETVEYRKGQRTGQFWKAFCPKCHMPLIVSPSYEGNAAFCSTKCGWNGYVTAEEIESALGWLTKQDKKL